LVFVGPLPPTAFGEVATCFQAQAQAVTQVTRQARADLGNTLKRRFKCLFLLIKIRALKSCRTATGSALEGQLALGAKF
jgi:hypothetical protein